jgi:hypothetical protein
MYDLNGEVAEKLKPSVFSTTSSPSRHDGEHACCRETMRQTDPPSDAGQRHFFGRSVTGPAGMRGDVFHDE